MNPLEIIALTAATVTVIMAVTTILVIRIVVLDTTSNDRAQILASTAKLIWAIRGKP